MSLWMFWSMEALYEHITEVLEEVLMGRDKDGVNAHEITNYSYVSFREAEQEKGESGPDMRELVERLITKVNVLSEDNRKLTSEVRRLRSELNGMKHTRTPDVSGKTDAKPAPPSQPVRKTPAQRTPAQSGSAQHSAALFCENAGNHRRVLRKFADEAQRLKRIAERNLSANGADRAFCLNLIEQCIRGFTALEAKSADFDAVDLAEESVKILKKTVCKALAKSELKPDIERYLEECGVKNMGWRVGKPLSDEEYACLEEPVFYDEVAKPHQDGTITKVERDSYYIDYEEDGLVRRAVIPGTYHIGKFRGRKA